jgi:hypothetical protein
MKKNITLFLALFNLSFVFSQVNNPNITDGHPSWIMQGNIYEVNVRQYTPEGTLNAFAKHLDRLEGNGCTNTMVHADKSHQQS